MRIAAQLAGVLLVTTVACRAMNRVPQRPPCEASTNQYELLTTVDRSARRFHLTLVSHSPRELCLLPHEWPDGAGRLHLGGARGIHVEVDGRRCNALDANLGDCPGGPECMEVVMPGDEITGFIRFSEFDCDLDKGTALRLSFSVSPMYCRGGRLSRECP